MDLRRRSNLHRSSASVRRLTGKPDFGSTQLMEYADRAHRRRRFGYKTQPTDSNPKRCRFACRRAPKACPPKRFELTAKQPQQLTPQHYEYSTGNQHEGSDCKDIIALGVLEVTGQALVVNE